MNLVADENVDAAIVSALRDAGHVVTYVRELDPGIDDERVLRLADSERALLLTSDKDFGELVFRQRLLHSGSSASCASRTSGMQRYAMRSIERNKVWMSNSRR
ncbi:DUF5615 family PIN-like protein [uncultured Thiodictyon sp.]|uniref:DUF5615 family PIN-like protein n=1 Tax=uncultured Thiodictyon sp. TaxID=1846217 RepID=UPI0025FB6479|nr:DUF5615 family PIN-like protein [uncultured Thiodictyon sp.]